jgi:hypothetical protein
VTTGSDFASLAAWVPAGAWADGTPARFSSLERMRATAGVGDLRGLFDAFREGLILPDLLRTVLTRGDADAVAASVGFGLDDVDAGVSFGTLPDTVSVIVGRFDAVAVAAALSADGSEVTSTPADPAVVGVPDATYIEVGVEGEVDIAAVSPARPIGEALRLLVSPSVIVWARTAAARDAALAAVGNGGAVPDDVTSWLAAAGSAGAHVVSQVPRADATFVQAIGYEVYGADGSSDATIFARYADTSAAESAPTAVAAAVADRPLGDAPPEVTVDGTVVTIRAEVESGRLMARLGAGIPLLP